MTLPVINLLVSADYELFLGRNFGDADEVLFNPTRQLLDTCQGLQVPVTFFADVCSVWAHRKFQLNEYAESFERQLVDAYSNNHDIQLHLHPHWMNSTYRQGQWQINTNKMYMSELGYGEDPDAAPALIERGIAYLNELLGQNSLDYKCVAFRAAGLALQPNERELIRALLNHGITLDSSIAKGLKFSSDTVEVDYSETPTKANWFLSAETGISSEATEGLFEIPIATFRVGWGARMGFLVRRLRSAGMRRGAGISRSTSQTRWSNLRTLISYNMKFLYGNPWFSLSCDTKGYSLGMLLNGLDQFIRNHREDDTIYISMINHPKLMFNQQFELLRSFIVETRKRYGESIQYITYQKAAEEIEQARSGRSHHL